MVDNIASILNVDEQSFVHALIPRAVYKRFDWQILLQQT